MSCYTCDMTALGCSGCDRNHIGFTTHYPFSYGLGSPLLSSKTLLHEFTLHLSAALLADDSPHKENIDASVADGTLGKYGRCRLSGAVQTVATQLSKELGPRILQDVEKVLEDDEAKRERARTNAEQAARDKAEEIARETAKETAEEVARIVAEKIAPEVANAKVQEAIGAMEAAQDMQNFEKTNMASFKNIPPAEFQQVIQEASKRAPAVVKRFKIPQNLTT